MGSTRDAAIRPAHGDFVEMRRDVNVFVSLPAAWEDVPDWLRRNGNVKPTQYVRFVEQQDFTTTIREPVIRRMGCTRGKTSMAADTPGGKRTSFERPAWASKHQLERIQRQLNCIGEELLPEKQRHAEPSTTDDDHRTAGSEQTRDRAGIEDLPRGGAQSAALKLDPGAGTASGREGRTLPAADPGAFGPVQGESRGESLRSWWHAGAELSYPALTAFCRRHGIGQTATEPIGHYHFEPGGQAKARTPHLTI